MTHPVVLYHANCPDGFASAYAAWCHFGEEAEYIPAQYGKPMPTISDVENAAVYMLDISWDRKTILDLRERAKDLLIIDHHATAEKELGGLDFAIFDMNKSGAVLTWEYFFGRGDK